MKDKLLCWLGSKFAGMGIGMRNCPNPIWETQSDKYVTFSFENYINERLGRF